MDDWGSVMTSNIFNNGAARRIELLSDVQRRLASSNESVEQMRSYAITMLHYACQAGDVAMVHMVLLLCRGVDINGRNVWGGTPLHSLCRYGHLKAQALSMREIALMFVMHGADLELRDNYKKTAADYARQNQIFEVSDVLSAAAGPPDPVQMGPHSTFLHSPPTSYGMDPAPRSSSLPPVVGSALSPSSMPPLPSALPSLPPVSPSSTAELHASHLAGSGVASMPASGSVSLDSHFFAEMRPEAESYSDTVDADAAWAREQDIRRKAKKKNNTVMRHLTMIKGDTPKPLSRPASEARQR